MKDHLRPVGKPAPPRPRRPEFLDLVDDPVAALQDEVLGAVPVAARARAGQARVVQAVEIGEDAVVVAQHRSVVSRRCRSASIGPPTGRGERLAGRSTEPGLRRLRPRRARRAASSCSAAVEVLVEVVVDLHHRRVDAGAQALDLDRA